MPFKSAYHTRKEKKCKYCDALAKRNISKNGRNKGFNRTCGSKICLSRQYADNAVNSLKSFARKMIEANCKYCGNIFIKQTHTQKWCHNCCSNSKERSLLQRYGISKKEWVEMYNRQNGKCCLCENEAVFVDHSHFTGKIRGLLCPKCNLGISYVENDKEWLVKAKKYVQIS